MYCRRLFYVGTSDALTISCCFYERDMHSKKPSEFLVVLTADASLLVPDYTEVELIYSRDEYRVAWTALWRERQREGSGRYDSKRQLAIGFVRHSSNQKLTSTSLDPTCQGIFFVLQNDVSWNVARITCLFKCCRKKIDIKVTSWQLDKISYLYCNCCVIN